jgi:hypothetical protein
LAQPVGQFLVNFSPVADGENPDAPRFTIKLVNNAESPNLVFPRPDNSRIRGTPVNGSLLKALRACLMLRFKSGGKLMNREPLQRAS